ncbi:MAG: hypothetical protein IH991_17500, partial [Planctomycetes bacterium]|nr:hypothetical protein [Planctomycetota bacterium]
MPFVQLFDELIQPSRKDDIVAWRVESGQLPKELPSRHVLCLFEGSSLRDRCREVPQAGWPDSQTGWLIPDHDVPLELLICCDEGSPLRTRISVRFVPELELGKHLCRQQQEVRLDTLTSLATSALSGLIDQAGHSPQSLVSLTTDELEQLRAHLSLLLQSHGLRCTSLAALEQASVDTSPNPAARNQYDAASYTDELVDYVQKTQDAEVVVPLLQAAGLTVSEDQLAKLQKQLSKANSKPDEIARRIDELVSAARRDAGNRRPDLRRWRGAALRLRVEEDLADQPSPNETPAVSSAREMPLVEKRPHTWWLLSQRAADRRLRRFLREVVIVLRCRLEENFRHAAKASAAADLRELTTRLRLMEDLLDTTP